jgi:hypothetical protein
VERLLAPDNADIVTGHAFKPSIIKASVLVIPSFWIAVRMNAPVPADIPGFHSDPGLPHAPCYLCERLNPEGRRSKSQWCYDRAPESPARSYTIFIDDAK